jgi:hypothetical protein
LLGLSKRSALRLIAWARRFRKIQAKGRGRSSRYRIIRPRE